MARRCRSVAFVGIDGAGKSTQARMLCDLLRARGARPISLHPYGRPILKVMHWGAATGGGGDQTQRPLATVLAWVDLAEILVYLWAQHARCALTTVLNSRDAWLVSDRSIDSTIVKHRLRHDLPDALLAFADRVAPHCQTTIWLRISPELAASRDRDFPLSSYIQMDEAHARAAVSRGWLVLPVDAASPDALFVTIADRLGLARPVASKSGEVG